MTTPEPFPPLPADHPAVRDALACPECEAAFVAGDVTCLLPLDTAAGHGLTHEAVLLHHSCAENALAIIGGALDRLTATFAEQPQELTENVVPPAPSSPGYHDKERLDWLGERLAQLPPEILGLVGLYRAGAGLRDAIDVAMHDDRH